MAQLFGTLTVQDSDREYVNTVGQEIVYEALVGLLMRWNADMRRAASFFVSGMTEDFKIRYKLPGGGRMQRRNVEGRPGVVKPSGQYDVAFPLEDFGDAIGGNDVDMAYMTIMDLEKTITTIFTRAVNTYRFEMLRAIFNNAQDTFVDPRKGTLLVEPLANGDTVVYPPILGASDGATEQHYLETGYIVSAISDTNDPIQTLRDELEEHYGAETGGENIAALCGTDTSAMIQTLTGFVPVPDNFVVVGDDTTVPVRLPVAPGKIVGRYNGCWVIEWRWMPATYIFGTHLEEEAPLMERIDEVDTGLPSGLALVARNERYPIEESIWRWRFGLGAANRLNGVVLEVANGGTYTVPTAYA